MVTIKESFFRFHISESGREESIFDVIWSLFTPCVCCQEASSLNNLETYLSKNWKVTQKKGVFDFLKELGSSFTKCQKLCKMFEFNGAVTKVYLESCSFQNSCCLYNNNYYSSHVSEFSNKLS